MKHFLILVATFASASLAGTTWTTEYVCKPFNGNRNACYDAVISCAKEGGNNQAIYDCVVRVAKEHEITSQDNGVKPDTAASRQCQYEWRGWDEEEDKPLKETRTMSCSEYNFPLCFDCGSNMYNDCRPCDTCEEQCGHI